MPNMPKNTAFKSPTDIARETFRRLAIERIAPTPTAYRKLYFDISGLPDEEQEKTQQLEARLLAANAPSPAEQLLSNFADNLKQSSGDLANYGFRFSRAIQTGNWEDYSKGLIQLTEKLSIKPPQNIISLVDGPVSANLASTQSNSISLVDPVTEQPCQTILKEMLFRCLSLALNSLLQTMPELAQEADTLGNAVKNAQSESQLNQIYSSLKQLFFQIEFKKWKTVLNYRN